MTDIQAQHGLDGYVYGQEFEGLEQYLSHLLMVSIGAQGSLGQLHDMLLQDYTQLTVEDVGYQITTMSSQLVTMLGSVAYFRVRMLLLLSTLLPSFCLIPTIMHWCKEKPMMERKTFHGALSIVKPSLHRLELFFYNQ